MYQLKKYFPKDLQAQSDRKAKTRPTNTSSSPGFTLIELMLAMALFSTILVVTTVVIIQVMGIYSKGIAVKQMNSIGRTVTDDLIRVGNNGSGSIDVAATSPRCVGIGSSYYIWSYATDSTTAMNVYRTSQGPVSFARLTGKNINSCPNPNVVLLASAIEPLLSQNVRVYQSTMKRLGSAPDLLEFNLILGTYSGVGSPNNPIVKGDGTVRCGAGTLGNFCAFGKFETVIYLPNGG